MTSTTPSTLQSAGPLLLVAGVSPGGGAVLFAADVTRARVLAFEVRSEDTAEAGAPGAAGTTEVRVDHLDAKLASLLGVEQTDVLVKGLAVHPVSHETYLSVARGSGAEGRVAIVRADAAGQLSVVELDELPFTAVDLDDAPDADDERQDVWLDGMEASSKPREIHGVTLNIAQVPLYRSTITDLAWVDGALFVAGLSNEEFTSRLRRIPFPFDGSTVATSVEIFHVDHGKYETQSPIRALTSFDGGASILATYTCTPVAVFSVADLRGEGLVRGRTVAELGPMNQPFSLVSYERDGEEFLLVSNTRHPLLKIPAASIGGQSGLTLGLSAEGASMGVPRESLDHPGVTWMANLDRRSIVVVQEEGGELHLRTLTAEVL
ncbi:hypothetical protein [Subtercola boreus]|uniref:Uncharacterized protein n=1 Tax=Subtercola boreus TaxID=120213 RepID=A0A3E0WDF3_9MICO|nr:hypothetical protein [Subtercola boreus]RFA21766.1 hypothetical protein B7R24_05630 [Subtercola boreus]RFA21878.1 hypothetical protein B7R23_05575 [Subtercola boreus]RFA27824.1 hypothetical protein B7R25_05700 [Subtercola boreus]